MAVFNEREGKYKVNGWFGHLRHIQLRFVSTYDDANKMRFLTRLQTTWALNLIIGCKSLKNAPIGLKVA